MALPPSTNIRKQQALLDILKEGSGKDIFDLLNSNPFLNELYELPSTKNIDNLFEDLKNKNSPHHNLAREFIKKEVEQNKFSGIKIKDINPTKTLHKKYVGIENKALLDNVLHAGAGLAKSLTFINSPLKIPKETVKLITDSVALIIGFGLQVDQKKRIATMAGLTKPFIIAGSAFIYANVANAAINSEENTAPAPPPISIRLLNQIKKPVTNGSIHAYAPTTPQFNQAVTTALNEFMERSNSRRSHPYMPILNLIKSHEANSNCNVAYGGKTYDLTKMSVRDVRALQEDLVNNGSPSSAMGCYQIIRSTLDYATKKLKLTGDELFDEALQEKMAITLLRKRGVDKYLNGTMELKDFVTELSKEWASLPKDTSNESYYKGDGLNKALVSHDYVVKAIHNMTRTAKNMASKPNITIGSLLSASNS